MPRYSERWFKQGSLAASSAGLCDPDEYLCPVCFVPYKDPRFLTREHVQPESLGGRALVLTSQTCNHSTGSTVEAAMKHDADYSAFQAGVGGRMVRLQFPIGAGTISAFGEARRNIDGTFLWDTWIDPLRVNPRLFQQLSELQVGHIVSMTPAIAVDKRQIAIGWLKAGYLIAFAAFGYRYVAQPSLELVRRQILEPASRVIPLQQRETRTSTYGLALVVQPLECQAIVVQCGPRRIFLPPLVDDCSFYKTFNIKALEREMTNRLKIIGLAYPDRPTFVLDNPVPEDVGTL